MLNKIKDVRVGISLLYSLNAKLNYAIKFRTEYIKDPGTIIDSVDVSKGISSDIIKYIEIFKTPVNIELAKEDALKIINTSLLNLLDEITATEKEVIKAINGIMLPVDDILKLLTNDDRMDVVGNTVTKANSSLPYTEVFEYRLSVSMNKVMASAGVGAPDYKTWLYGIYKELEEDTTIDSMGSTSYESYVAYVNGTDKVVSNKTHTVIDYEPAIKDDSVYSHIISYTTTPESDISGLAIITGILKIINNQSKDIAALPNEPALDFKVMTDGYSDKVSEELKVIDTAITSLDAHRESYLDYIHKLTITSNAIIDDYSVYYDEYNKQLSVHSLLATVCIN